MKFIVKICVLLTLLLASCKHTKTRMEEITLGCEECKATAILWVDKEKGKKLAEYATSVRTVKVYAKVYSDGTFKILNFCKKQEPKVERYIRRRAEAFVIRKEMYEGNYISPGEQYLQLRYVPSKIK